MTNIELHDIMCEIIKGTFPEISRTPYIELINKNRKTMHGDYDTDTRKIRIFNLYRESNSIIGCSIHELAHFCEHCLTGSTGHQKTFYEIYRKLMITAIKKGYLDYEKLRTQSDIRDIIQQEKYFGPIRDRYDKASDATSGKQRIEVTNCYEIRDMLKENGYKWDGQAKVWYIVVDDIDLAQDEIDRVHFALPKAGIEVRENKEITIDTFTLIILTGSGTYENKEYLKENGFLFKGYGVTKNAWVKRVNSRTLPSEIRVLTQIEKSDDINIETKTV